MILSQYGSEAKPMEVRRKSQRRCSSPPSQGFNCNSGAVPFAACYTRHPLWKELRREWPTSGWRPCRESWPSEKGSVGSSNLSGQGSAFAAQAAVADRGERNSASPGMELLRRNHRNKKGWHGDVVCNHGNLSLWSCRRPRSVLLRLNFAFAKT